MKRVLLRFVIILIIIELVLRATGWFYYIFSTYKPLNKDDKAIRILCLGESTTFGLGAKREDNYPAQLNGLLEEKYSNEFLVYNKGIPGTTSSDILLRIERSINETNPSLVILLCGANEDNPQLNYTNSNIILKTRSSFVNNLLFDLTNLLYKLKTYRVMLLIAEYIEYYKYNKVLTTSHFIPKERNFKEFDVELLPLIMRQYNSNIDKITEYVRKRGADIIYSTYLTGTLSKEINDAAYRNGAILCDQLEICRDAGISVTGLISDDGFHPNASGYRVMAENLYKCILKNKLKINSKLSAR